MDARFNALDALVPEVPMDLLGTTSAALPAVAISSVAALAIGAFGFLVAAVRDSSRRRHAIEVLATCALGITAVAAATLHDDAVYRLRFRLDADAWAPRFAWLAVAGCGVVGLLAALMILRVDSSGRSRGWAIARDLLWAIVCAVVIVGSAPGARAGNLRSFAVATLVPVLAALLWRAIASRRTPMPSQVAPIWGSGAMVAMIGLVLLTALVAVPKRGIAPGAVTLASVAQAESYAVDIAVTYLGCSGGAEVGWDDLRAVTVEESPDAVVIQAMVRYPASVWPAFTCEAVYPRVGPVACTVALADPIGGRTLLARFGSTVEPIDASTAIDGSIYAGTCPQG